MIRVALALLLVSSSFAQTSAKPEPLDSRHISVTDKRGNPVKLGLSDLRITIDGANVTPVALIPFRELRLLPVVMLDFSGSMRDKEAFAKKCAADAVEVLSSYGAKPATCVFNEKRLCNIQAGEVLKELDKIHPSGSDDLSNPLDSAEMFMGQQALQEKNPFVRTIVLITDGDLKDIPTTRLKRDNIVVFPIGLLGPPDSISQKRKKLIDLAVATQGRAILIDAPGDIKKQLKRLLDSEYEVLFTYPKGVTETTDIRIGTASEGLKINAY